MQNYTLADSTGVEPVESEDEESEVDGSEESNLDEEESEGINEDVEGVEPAPDREEGEGPFENLVIKDATMIDGTGAPPEGPMDILIEDNVIKQVGNVEDDIRSEEHTSELQSRFDL